MPQRCPTPSDFDARLRGLDWVISRTQALTWGLSEGAIEYRLRSGQWTILLPNVYLAHRGEPSRRQVLRAGLVWAGPDALIDDLDACWWHGLTSLPVDPGRVRVVVPQQSPARSRGFVTVRRTMADLESRQSDFLKVLGCADAVVAAGRTSKTARGALAIASEALQRQKVSHAQLVEAHIRGPRRNSIRFGEILDSLSDGIRSVAESDFRDLIAASSILPMPAFNQWMRLADGRLVCVDALFADAALIHETNGRAYHQRDDLFDDMQSRHDALTTVGFSILHNSPRVIRANGPRVLKQVEDCYRRDKGRPWPAGAVLIDPPSLAAS